MQILGIGSRIVHPELGKGVVVNVSPKHYWVSFLDSGLETIDLDSEIEVIEALHDEVDTISFSEVETSLIRILRRWSDVSPLVPISDKWKGGNLVLQPGDMFYYRDEYYPASAPATGATAQTSRRVCDETTND